MNTKLEHNTHQTVTDGRPEPLGAALTNRGVNFALFSSYAEQVYLLLFDNSDTEASDTIKMKRTGDVWHVHVDGIAHGQLYGYKVAGPYDPAQGVRFNPHKLLLDPYAKAVSGKMIDRDKRSYGYNTSSKQKDLSFDNRDNSVGAPKAIVIDDEFDWKGDRHPRIDMHHLIIYEVHVKGFTAHSSSGVEYPGTYLGFIEKIPYLKDLGINAVELLPIHEFHVRDELVAKGLSEYWGYNTIGFFAPESSYAAGAKPGSQVEEFKQLVRALHREGIEVILDVVYNHTGEGNHLGPTLSFRGIDNPTYYALEGTKEEPYRYYVNDAGTGNTINAENDQTRKLILDSLRYWVEVMHVDGFRFDLASVLAKVEGEFDHKSMFFEEIEADPVLKKVKLIAEPWDMTTYQVGNFPHNWSEWNGKYRDTARSFLRGDRGLLGEIAYRVTGSEDLYGDDGRRPYHSINFITCHDGFTLNDLFSYNRKHNEANKEENRDGSDHNISWNCGIEGPTNDPLVCALRERMIRNSICLLFFSIGTPMMLGGDEFLRSQHGNNNGYCQDNELSWFDWDHVDKNREIHEFFKKAIALRKRYPVLQRRHFMKGKDTDGDSVLDIEWFGADLRQPVWDNEDTRLICFQLDGSEIPSDMGDYHLFLIFNSHDQEQLVHLPQYEQFTWHRVIDTSRAPGEDFLNPGEEEKLDSQELYRAPPMSVVVLLATH
jgi:glycogen operon protein